MLDVGDDSNKRGGSDSKDVLDLLLGFTQVLGRTTVLRVNYSYSDSSGYLNDPYKILSVVDPVTGDTLARTPASGSGPERRLSLSRAARIRARKQSLYAEMKHEFGAQVLHVAYRFMTDDWDIDSHTGEARLRWPLGDPATSSRKCATTRRPRPTSIVPAWSSGSAAARSSPRPMPARRLRRAARSDSSSATRTASGNEWSTRLEYYQQNGHGAARTDRSATRSASRAVPGSRAR